MLINQSINQRQLDSKQSGPQDPATYTQQGRGTEWDLSKGLLLTSVTVNQPGSRWLLEAATASTVSGTLEGQGLCKSQLVAEARISTHS